MNDRKRKEFTYNDHQHAYPILLSGPVAGHEENDNRNRNGGQGETKFIVLGVVVTDDDGKLHGEAKKEEEIEFEKGNVDLSRRVSVKPRLAQVFQQDRRWSCLT